MAVINAVTGLKRKLPRYFTPRKKRQTGSSTVASRMYAENAMEAFYIYMIGVHYSFMMILAVIGIPGDDGEDEDMLLFMMAAAGYFFQCALRMLTLDSELIDIHNPEDDVGFHKVLEGIGLDNFVNDNECESN